MQEAFRLLGRMGFLTILFDPLTSCAYGKYPVGAHLHILIKMVTRLRLTSFAEFEGIFESMRDDQRMVILLEFLGRSLKVVAPRNIVNVTP